MEIPDGRQVILDRPWRFIIFGVWLHNRRADPGTPVVQDFAYPMWVRVLRVWPAWLTWCCVWRC